MSSAPPRMAPLVAGVVLGATAATAHAQTFDAFRRLGPPDQDVRSVGAVVLQGRDYLGSSERRTQFLPRIDYLWRNGWFAGTTNGIGYNFSKTPGTDYGLRVTADFGRQESRSSALRGLGDIDIAAEAGGFFNYALTPSVTLTSSVRYGSGKDSKGALLDLGLSYSTLINPSWRLGATAGTTYANRSYMQDFFGITPQQAAASGYANYRPNAGLRDARASLALTYLATPRVAVTGVVSAVRLLNDAADSPLTQKANTVNGLLTVSYAF